jgi:hypothetical protein
VDVDTSLVSTRPEDDSTGRGDTTFLTDPRLRLVLLSFLLLFLELALIRWTGSNIVHLSYFSNFVLLGSFLGIGIGFLRAKARVNLFPFAPIALVLLVAYVRFFPVEVKGSGSDLIYFGDLQQTGPPRWVTLTAIFLVVAATMALLGEGVARTFKSFQALDAYRYDLLGSLAGIIVFSALSFLGAPPLAWGVIVTVVLLFVFAGEAIKREIRVLQILSLTAILVMLAIESFAPGFSWSPYYKIETENDTTLNTTGKISVNGLPHQSNLRARDNALYNNVYKQLAHKRLDNVLIIGAGGGNDVSAALFQGAKHIDAVEIDPKLQELGVETHPEHPYDSPKVSVHINDGRAFLESTDRKYDLILFALPDSLTLVAGQSSLRLESYLFTKEALESARDHLKPNGAFSMYNFYRDQWLLDRYANTLDQVFHHPPCQRIFGLGGKAAVLVDARHTSDLSCEAVWNPGKRDVPDPATDNHPFPYLRTPSIPGFYAVTIGFILLASLILVRVTAGPLRRMSSYVDLFFMGVAFLLLETKSVVQFALLFGTTWFVNALVFAGILVSVLCAVQVSKRVTFKRPELLYLALLAALTVAYLVPPSALLPLATGPRFIAAVLLAFTPIFIANLVFTQRFRDTASSTTAFGANLLGAMVGGLLEYSALVIGYRSLLILVAVAYGLAFLTGRRYLGRVPAAT